MRNRRNSTPPLFLIVLLLAGTILAWLAATGEDRPQTTPSQGELLVAVLDVGQGDSILVRSPTGRTMLVDAGNARADTEQVILPFLETQGIASLDYLVLTHPDQDHLGGMPAVLDRVPVGTFVDPVLPDITNQTYLQVLQRVQSKNTKPMKARRGQTEIDMGSEIAVQLLAPEEPLLSDGNSVTNNNSIVMRITYGTVSVLLTADMEQEGERRLLEHEDNLRAQILKVGHHGSRYSSSEGFLKAVNPEVALISVGADNPYGHPHPQLLQRLAQQRIKLFRTDESGTLLVRIDGHGYTVSPEKERGG